MPKDTRRIVSGVTLPLDPQTYVEGDEDALEAAMTPQQCAYLAAKGVIAGDWHPTGTPRTMPPSVKVAADGVTAVASAPAAPAPAPEADQRLRAAREERDAMAKRVAAAEAAAQRAEADRDKAKAALKEVNSKGWRKELEDKVAAAEKERDEWKALAEQAQPGRGAAAAGKAADAAPATASKAGHTPPPPH